MNEELRQFVIAVMEEITADSERIDKVLDAMEVNNKNALLYANESGKLLGMLYANAVIHKHYRQMKGEENE
jgi:hypothetical protein